MILGLTGGYGSGKDVIADYLVEKKGFLKISLSDILRQECKEARKELTRENLTKKGNEMRRKFGPWILGKIARERIDPSKDYAVVSIRNPAEVKELKRLRNFFLIHVTGPTELRYKRVLQRDNGEEKYSSIQEFLETEKRELQPKLGDKDAIDLEGVFAKANIILDNKYEDVKELYKVVDRMYSDIRSGKVKR